MAHGLAGAFPERTVLAAGLLAALVSGAFAVEPLAEIKGRYAIAPQSSIAFTIAQVGGGGISGRFTDFSGDIELYPDNPGRSRVAITLEAASVATGQERVENFLRSDAVFDAATYPEISFRSSRVIADGDRSATVEGMLRARGQSRPETFHVTLLRQREGRVIFHVVGKVLRSRYGMDVGTPIYSNVVRLDMVVEGKHR